MRFVVADVGVKRLAGEDAKAGGPADEVQLDGAAAGGGRRRCVAGCMVSWNVAYACAAVL